MLNSSSSNSINENENDDIEQQQQQQQQYNVVLVNDNGDEQQTSSSTTQSRPPLSSSLPQLDLIKQASERMQTAVVQRSKSISLSTQIAATTAVAQVMNAVNEIGSHPLQQQQGGENESDTDGKGEGGVTVKGQDNDQWITKVGERGVFVVGIAAFIAAIWSFIAVGAQLADLNSLTVLLLSPTVMIQKKKLNQLGSLRTLQQELRKMAHLLATENGQMQQSVTSMESHLQRLNNVESQLTKLAHDDSPVERLVHVVEEHSHVQAELKRVLQDDVTHQLFSALLQSDVNGNYRLTHPDETNILEQRLENVQGVIFNKDNFRKLLQSSDGTFDLTLTDAANLARALQRDDDIPDAEKVFIFRPLDILKNNNNNNNSTTTTTAAAVTNTTSTTTTTATTADTATATTTTTTTTTGAAAAAVS